MTQQFFKGDLVYIAGDLGPTMTHFPKGVDAIVLYSYNEHYGERGENCGDRTIRKLDARVSVYPLSMHR